MRQHTVDYIESFLSNINFKTNITSAVFDGTNTTLTVDYVFYAREGLTIAIDTVDATIVSVDYTNKQIVVSGDYSSGSVAELQALQYFHGTPLAVNEELSAISLTTDKAPLLYVYEVIVEDNNHVVNEVLGYTASVRMAFLDDSSKYITTDENYSYVLTPLSNLVEKFKSELLKDRSNLVRNLITTSRQTNHVKFGTYVDGKGHERKIFQDTLTGIELQIDLPFRKIYECTPTQPTTF